MRPLFALALCGVGSTIAAGCGLLLDADPVPLDTDPRLDSGVGDTRTGPGDAARLDAMLADAAPTDAMAVDAMRADAADAARPCPVVSDPGVVAHYSFDMENAGEVLDRAPGMHHGTRTRTTDLVPGRCGDALAFPRLAGTAEIPHARIPDGDAFELSVGSLELYVNAASYGHFGIVSRDEINALEPGHFGLFLGVDGYLVVRIQDREPEDNAVWLCSNAPIPLGDWVHVGVSWGGAEVVELWVNGALATNTDPALVWLSTGSGDFLVPCGTTTANLGIDGNSLSLVFGASTALRSGSIPERYERPFVDGAIDEVVFRSVRVDFTRR